MNMIILQQKEVFSIYWVKKKIIKKKNNKNLFKDENGFLINRKMYKVKNNKIIK
jgi:hypothetical protein